MAQYASSFLDLGLGIPKLFGDVAGMCGFALLMGIGRTLLGLWGDRWDLPRVLGASALLAASRPSGSRPSGIFLRKMPPALPPCTGGS